MPNTVQKKPELEVLLVYEAAQCTMIPDLRETFLLGSSFYRCVNGLQLCFNQLLYIIL